MDKIIIENEDGTESTHDVIGWAPMIVNEENNLSIVTNEVTYRMVDPMGIELLEGK